MQTLLDSDLEMTTPPSGAARIVFDLSTAAHWIGAPAGIARTQRELALWARRHLPQTVFVVFDPVAVGYRVLNPRFVDAFIAGCASIDAIGLPDPTGSRKRRSAAMPASIYAVIQGRRSLLRILERARLRTAKPAVARLADRLQRRLMSKRYRPAMLNADGTRRDFVSPDMALAEPVQFSPDDVLICTGIGWNESNIAKVARLKREVGFRMAVLCCDIIPLQFPQWFKPHDVANARRYWPVAFETADITVFHSRAVARDVRSFCAERTIPLGATAICPLGADPAGMLSNPNAELPYGLKDGRYAVFVSTIEPRKGHQLLCRVWSQLIAEGLPQASGFKLVFVGRRGWMNEAFDRTLRDRPELADWLVILPHVADETLDLLYRRAAFCLYPSLYEGYGLPVIEAFARGKAVLASTGGSLPEVVGEFSPCLDPHDEGAWRERLRSWIENPTARAPFEAAIRERFHHPSWDEAARQFFATVDDAVGLDLATAVRVGARSQ